MSISRIRTVGLAVVTLLGTAHLAGAEATPLKSDTCDDNAEGYAEAFCRAMGHDDWSSVSYGCEDGTPQIDTVTCIDRPDEEEEPVDEIG